MFRFSFSLFAVFSALSIAALGCGDDDSAACAAGSELRDGVCTVIDAGMLDMRAPDFGPMQECGACTAPTPVCDPTDNVCVGCVRDDDCPSDNRCDESARECVGCLINDDCPVSAPICDVDLTKTCVECTANDQCDVGAPVCEANACTGCSNNDQCAMRPDTPTCGADGACTGCAGDMDCASADLGQCDVATGTCIPCSNSSQCTAGDAGICDEGTCVECTIDDESGCGGNSCNPGTLRCTNTALASLNACETCTADSECPTDHACVPVQFMGADSGAYCLKDQSAGCEAPFVTPIMGRTSLSGQAGSTYCGPAEGTTTCEAIVALTDGDTCPSGMDNQCPDGALCRMLTGLAGNRCTFECTEAGECPASAASCGNSGNGMMFCGGS